MKRFWSWIASFFEEHLRGQPKAEGDAIRFVDKAESLLAGDGSVVRFAGRALEWDLSKDPTIGLEFEAPWFTRREIELFAWSSVDVSLSVDSPALEQSPTVIALSVGSFASPRLKVLARKPSTGNVLRVLLNSSAVSGTGKVFFGLGDTDAAHATRIRAYVEPSPELGHYLSTWLNLASLLFILLAGFGLKTSSALAAVLLVVPAILEKLGAGRVSGLSPGAIAQWLRKRVPRLVPVWRLATVPLVGTVAYMMSAFVFFALYEAELNDHLDRQTVTIQERADFFCRYPERIETRVLLAKHLEIRSAVGSLMNAYESAMSAVSLRRFLDTCLAPVRFSRWLSDDAPRHETLGRILYASLHWNTSLRDQFDERYKRTRDILGQPGAGDADRLRQITLAKYRLKAVKNANEQVHCKQAASPECLAGRTECLAARADLERLLSKPLLDHERWSVAYLEAHDVLASSHLSTGCSYGKPEDTEAAIRHYYALMGALPRTPKLEQPLTQINFRKFIDSRLEKLPEHPTSRLWKEECDAYFQSSCREIEEAFIKDQKQTFFEFNREERNESWGRASITFLEGDKLRARLLEELKEGWTWPL